MIIYTTNNVTVFQSALFQLNSTVVTTNDLVLVVDPGFLPSEIDQIRLYVDKVKGERPIYLYFTHSDYDHIVGYGAFPDAKTIASEQFVTSEQKERQLHDAIRYDDEFYIARPSKLEYPTIDHVIKADEEQLTIGQTVLTFHHAFGHTHDGLILVFETENLAVVGDYLSDIEFPFVDYSYKEYTKTLGKLESICVGKSDITLITSHGSVTNEPSEIKKRMDDSNEYIELVKKQATMEQFEQFLTEKSYQFTTILRKRHEDNVQRWKKEVGY